MLFLLCASVASSGTPKCSQAVWNGLDHFFDRIVVPWRRPALLWRTLFGQAFLNGLQGSSTSTSISGRRRRRRRRKLLIHLGNRFPPRMVALPRPSARLPAPRAIITAVVVVALVFFGQLHTSLISLMAVTGATATDSFNGNFHGNIWFGPVRSTGGGLPGQPPVSEIVGLPIASATLTCATRLQYFFAVAICWTCF